MSFIPSSPQAQSLTELIRLWVFTDPPPSKVGAQILDQLYGHVRKVVARYPEAYFPLGRRSDDHIAELTHEVFYRCDRVPLPYAPYNGRTPFRTFAEEDFSPAHVLGLVIYARRAILRGILRDHYERNLRRDPLVRLDAERFATIRRVLRARCAPVESTQTGVLRYRPIPAILQVVLREDEIVERLRRRAADSVEDRALAVVRWLQEASVEQVHALITAADPLPLAAAPDQPPEELPERHLAAAPVDGELISAVRVAVVRGWAKLGPEERRLMRAVTSGTPYTQLVAEEPAWGSPAGLTRALRRCNAVIDAELRAELSISPPSHHPHKPAVIAGLILDVLDSLPKDEP
jgi:hypothetical protein